MYESYFRFKDTPFRLSADEKFRYAHKNYLRASAYLAYALEQGEGFVMITGQPGSGKTTLIRDVISELDEARYNTLHLVTSQLQAEELLRKVALEYEFPAETANKATLLTDIQKHLSRLHEEGKRSILFLDEAQNLTPNGLEELRLLSNLQQGKNSLLQVVLVGHNELRQLVLRPDMKHLQQRLIASCQIEPLSAEQTREYILHRLQRVDWQADPRIEDEVYQLIHIASQGVPRNINHLMSHLLLYACLEEKHHLTDEDALTIIDELVEQQRITLVGEESFEEFADRYRAEKQHQEVLHVVGNDSSISMKQQEHETWNHEPLDTMATSHRIDSKTLIPVNDDVAPARDTKPETPDSEWLLWRDDRQRDGGTSAIEEIDTTNNDQAPIDETSPELTLPDADDIWNGAVKTTDMDNLFPENRRQKSTFSLEPSKYQSATQPAGGQTTSDREHRWGGVWFMSSRDQHDGAGRRSNTISILKQDHNMAVNENLSMPSVWVEDCPDIVATNHDTSHRHQIPHKDRTLNRSIFHIVGLVCVGALVILAIRIFPDELNQLLHIPQAYLSNKTEQSTTRLPSEEAQVAIPSNDPANNIRESEKPETSVTQHEKNRADIEAVNRGNGLDEDSPTHASTELKQVNDQTTVAESQQLEWGDDSKQQSGESEITTSGELSPAPVKFDNDSYHNIELATRYIIYFDFNRSSILTMYEPLLKSIRDKMLLNENNFLRITGYADSQGNNNYNYQLSLKRAEAVKAFFAIRGIAEDRLQVTAVGSVKKGVSRFETINTRKKIRRVEVILFPR